MAATVALWYSAPMKPFQVPSAFTTTFTLEYGVSDADMRRLYENAKRDQWHPSKDIPWTDALPSDGRVNEQDLFDSILAESRWYLKTIALQLVAETFAVALFKMMSESALDPVLGTICKRILQDESRHMGFGMLSLPRVVSEASETERRE